MLTRFQKYKRFEIKLKSMGSFEEITEELKKFKVIEKAVRKKNRIQVSSIKKPIYFYVNLAKVLFRLLCFFLNNFYQFLTDDCAFLEISSAAWRN